MAPRSMFGTKAKARLAVARVTAYDAVKKPIMMSGHNTRTPKYSRCLGLAVRVLDRRKLHVIGAILTVWFACLSPAVAVADDADLLRLRIYYRSAEDLRKEACTWLGVMMTRQQNGFLEAFPVDRIAAVEVQGDETILASPLLLRFLKEGRFGDTS